MCFYSLLRLFFNLLVSAIGTDQQITLPVSAQLQEQ